MGLEVIDVLEGLESKLAYVPGGRDREGRPIFIVNVPVDTQETLFTNSGLEKVIEYLLSIFNDETKRSGICLVVDARRGSWRVARSYIRRSINMVGNSAGRTIVIRPDGFWEKRVDHCTKSWKDSEPAYIPITRLNSYVDTSQITQEFGGTKYYEHSEWIQNRIKVEEYQRNTVDLIEKLTDLRDKLCQFDPIMEKKYQEEIIQTYWDFGMELEGAARHVLQTGRVLASLMSAETSQDFQDTVHRIHDILDTVELKQVELENAWSRMTENLDYAEEIKELEEGLTEVTNWILGPADAMLNSRCFVGFDVASSENLRREHEELELECRETYGRYAKLLHRIDMIPENHLSDDLKSQRDFMDFVCRSFATRLERRRNVLIISQRFFRLVSEYFDKTSEVFDTMVMGNRACGFSEAEVKLKSLETSQDKLDGLLRELIKEGEKLSDILSIPVKDALGRDVNVDYGEDIINIKDILDATNARKNIFNDSVELQKLTLKQIISIHTYEKDAEQAITWLSDLFGVLVENHVEIGCNATEIQMQKEELQSFQETAQGTFDYGCQLLNGARVLRISCRLTLDSNSSLFAELKRVWRRLRSVGQVQLTRLRVCTVFHRSVDEHCSALVELISTLKTLFLSQKKSPADSSPSESSSSRLEGMRDVLESREKLLVEVGRTVRLGRLLRSRLKEPLYTAERMPTLTEDVASEDQKNLTAVDAISERLAEVTRLAEKLDKKLYEAGARTRISKDHDNEKFEVSAMTPTNISPTPASAGEVSLQLNPSDDHQDDVPEPEEINTEDYMTATEGSVTPMVRSRSESFVTMSECEDAADASARFGSVEGLQQTTVESTTAPTEASARSAAEREPEKILEPITNIETSRGVVDYNRNGLAELNKINSTSIVEKIEEKSGKVVKEVTEITTLRVSQNTKFGVTSFKLTANTHTENKEHADTRGILHACQQCIDNPLPDDDKEHLSKHMREEITLSEGPSGLENGYHSKVSKIIKESITQENNHLPEEFTNGKVTFLETKGNDDSGIEMTARNEQIDREDCEDIDFFQKLKMSGEWLRLKVLEVSPEVTKLGVTVDEAKRLSSAHDEVLIRLQSKQSPVEELLRQADQLISTQRPRAEVYAAMAETLGQAWKDVNALLELQKQILDHNVLFQCRAEEFRLHAKALELACNDNVLPIEIEVVKKFLNKIHDLRKTMLGALMGALQEGRTLLDYLREVASEGTLDSRPDRIKADADHAVLQVEKWLEELHDQRTLIELSFTNRKTQLEQCLALALLATDLRDLEEILTDRVAALSSSSDQLGDSSSSAELLLFELKKLQSEAKEFQDRSLKITKSTEKLVSSKHFAGEQATEQAYAILEAAADYINDLEQYEGLLNKAIAFFESARSAFTKLDQLEIQLATTEYPPHSPQLARFHAQTAATLSEVTSSPLAEGYALLDVTGRGAPGAEGVKRTVDELENRKIRLLERCTAHKEENLRIARGLTVFFDKYDELKSWLEGIADAFLRGHQDMGSDLPMAADFYQIHCQLLTDLCKRGDEIDEALSILSSTIIEITDERQRAIQKSHVEDRVDALRDSWLDCRHSVEARLQLIALYVEFHEAAVALSKQVDEVESEFKKNGDNLEEGKIQELEKRWNDLQPLYLKLTNSGTKFLAEAEICTDAYLDIPRARLCVETTLERFANRQLTVTESWENWQTSVVTTRERRIEQERRVEESTKTLTWASKFGEQLYPILASESTRPFVLLQDLESTQLGILPELKKAVTELESRIKSVEGFSTGDDKTSERIKGQLSNVFEHLRATAVDYQSLLESLIAIFQDLVQIENNTDEVNQIYHNLEASSSGFLTESGRQDIRSKAEKLQKLRDSFVEVIKNVEPAVDRVISRIEVQEPRAAARQDVEKLKQVFEFIINSWKSADMETKIRLDKRLLFCNFADDLDRIDADLRHLSDQLTGSAESGHRFTGDSLPAAETASQAFYQFEETIIVLEKRIENFVKTTEANVELTSPDSLAVIHRELTRLQDRWSQLKLVSEATRERINATITYFKLLEDAKNWYREGNKLLIIIARKSSAAKTPEEVEECLTQINEYLKPGEECQEKRIEAIRELSTRIFGTDRLPQFNEVVVENRETLDSFAVIMSELRTLAQNLKNSAEVLEKQQRLKEQEEEELRKLNAARVEAQAAYEAEIERKRLAVAMEEKKKLEHTLKSSVSAQTDQEVEREQQVVEETVTSAVTTREIRLLQKTEVEEEVPVLVAPIPQVHDKPKESRGDFEQEVIQEVSVLHSQPPNFVVPLSDVTIEEGHRFTFECRLDEGTPKPEIIWYKDGISILNNPDYQTSFNDDTGICTLTIEETFAEDSARFTCKAFNIAGLAETGATLTIKEITPTQQLNPPAFIKELRPSVALKGSTHFLSCTVTGNPLPTVQWFKDQTNIDDSPDYTITYNNGEAVVKFLEILPEDKAIYTCQATNKLGQASTSANLEVEVPADSGPVQVIQTNGLSSLSPELDLDEKDTATHVRIIKEQRIIEESRTVKIESHSETMGGSASQVMPDAPPKENLNQEIIAVHKVETLEKSTEMPEFYSVPEAIEPSVQLPLKDVQVFEGKTVRLDCVIIGQPEPEVIWYHDDQPVKESADFQLLFQGDRCSLVIHEAYLDDAGKYKVVAINSKGEASSECILSVIPFTEVEKQAAVGSAPQFVKLITDVLVSEGEDALFECQVTGEPKPDLRWFFNNEEIVFVHERITMLHDEHGVCALKICKVTPEDKGNYVAKATNLHGEVKAIARLVVKPSNESFKREELVQMEEKLVPPSFEKIFEDQMTITSGLSTKFECIVHGKPTPKIQWFFNDKPVHGKSFLVSVSGDRQVLTIPEVTQEHVGSISCVAENTAGKASCTAQLEVKGEETRVAAKGVEDVEVDLVPPHEIDMQATSSSEKQFTTERRTIPGDQVDETVLTKMSSSISQSSTTRSSCIKEFKSSTTSNILEPTFKSGPGNFVTKSHIENREYSSQQNGGPPVVQSHKVEEFEQIVQESPGQVRQERTKIITEGSAVPKMQKPTRKNVAPRFVSPVTGMIVDQCSDVVLEGIIDGYPLPTITWTKNGQDLKECVKTTFEHNHVRLELKNVNVKDAGRYTCQAVNEVGSASSTADLVVKKTIFPPVFGKRLQAQVAKKGDRVIMEVEITGTPEPTVTWYKDDEPLMDTDGVLKQLGNCYLLIIDAAEKRHAGKYMVHAMNAGGEGQSIADFAVFEPTPDTMVEVHKTIVYENVADKNLKLEEKKTELPSAALTAEHIATTTIQPSSTLKTVLPTSSSTTSSQIRKIEMIGPKGGSQRTTEESVMEKATRSEMISSTIETHQSETKSEQKFHMKLQHQAPLILDSETPPMPAPPTITTTTKKISTQQTQSGGEPVSTKTTEFMETSKSDGTSEDVETNENVETSTINKRDALSFFESMSKDSEMTPKGPKAMIKLTEEDTDGNYDVKVDKLTKNYERSTKFEETKKPTPESPSKKSVHDFANKFETPVITKGVDNVMIDFPYNDYKLPPLNIQRTILEDTTASGSPIHGSLTISKLVAQSESAEKMMSGFNLVPEPPPEIGYMPKAEEEPKKRVDISTKAKQLQESQKKPVDAPIGGVKLFPVAPAKPPSPPEKKDVKPKPTVIPPPFELGKTEEYGRKEVIEETCMKKDVHRKDDMKRSAMSPAPASPPKGESASEKWWSSTSDLETRSHVSTDLSEYRCQSASSSQFEARATSPKPSADGLAMEKSWAKSKTSEANRKSWPPPAVDKETTKSFSKLEEWREPEVGYKTSTHEQRQEIEEVPGGGMTKTNIESTTSLETRSWSTKESRMEQTSIEKPTPPPPKPIIKPVKAPSPPKPVQPVTMYKAETTKVDHIVNAVQEQSMYEKYSSDCEVKKMESSEKFSSYEELKAPGLVKAIPSKPLVKLYHTTADAPKTESEHIKSFQETTSFFKGSQATAPKIPCVQLYHQAPEAAKDSGMILEVGPPAEIGYMPAPPTQMQTIERIEKTYETSRNTQPVKMPQGPTRAFPPCIKTSEAPPIPPKDARAVPPPLPTKKVEPFGAPVSTCVRSVPTPCKFAKGQFIESDYESDFESCRSKWRPYESDNEEPKYRRVQAPTPRQPRPKSTEPEPPPPSSFEVPPPELTGPPRPVVTPDYSTENTSCKKTSTFMSRNERSTKQQQYQSQGYAPEPNLPKPGSPPIYVTPKSYGNPESPKFKTRSFQQESGYMADTDEPFYQRTAMQKNLGKESSSTSSSNFESRQFMESKTYMSSSNQRREESSSSSTFTPASTCPKSQMQRSSYCEKSYTSSSTPATTPRGFRPDKEETSYSWSQSQKTSSAPSPSRFARGEFRESDYESDYEGRIPPLWKPRGDSDVEDHSFKSVKPNLAGKSTKPVNKLTTEAISSQTSTLEKESQVQKTQKIAEVFIPRPIPVRQKSVLLPGSPPEIAYAPPRPQTYYEARSGMPFHNAVGTETKKTVRMDESTENSRRIVTVEQTSRVIKFGEDQNGFDKPHSLPRYQVPQPKKFVQGQFKESDYESDVDTGRIRPKWAPPDSDTEDPQYRKVQPPRFRSSSAPPPPERCERVVTPMEFDKPPVMTGQTQTFEQHLRQLNAETEKLKKDKGHPGYGYSTLPLERKQQSRRHLDGYAEPDYVSGYNVKRAANHVASKHMTDMTSSFKAKTEKFVHDIQSDLKQSSKPILKHTVDKHTQDGEESQAYREEKRMSQYGTKHVDPDTGLIYFKYDFGYEFGIVLPGESKKTVASSSNSIQGQRRASDIDVPIVHEFTNRPENGFTKTPWHVRGGPNKFSSSSKTVKWEPTSESEFSEAEDSFRRKKRGMLSTPPTLLIPQRSTSPRWDPTTPSPMSLSPSLPSFSPRHSSAATGPPSNVDSFADSPWPTTNGVSPGAKEIIQPYLDILPKKAPLFITPLRDIAVVSGQTARFECIVQAEPQPNILWSKDGRIIENSPNYEVYYRNGVCRLVIPCAYPDDAGTYVCTATNNLGSTATSATLQVPGNRRSMYGTK